MGTPTLKRVNGAIILEMVSYPHVLYFYNFGEKLQSRELSLVLSRTAIIVREEPFLISLFS